jgi:hypothetical protein
VIGPSGAGGRFVLPSGDGFGHSQSAREARKEADRLACDAWNHQTVALDIVRRPKGTPIHELERYMQAQPSGGAEDDESQRAIRRRRGGRGSENEGEK